MNIDRRSPLKQVDKTFEDLVGCISSPELASQPLRMEFFPKWEAYLQQRRAIWEGFAASLRQRTDVHGAEELADEWLAISRTGTS